MERGPVLLSFEIRLRDLAFLRSNWRDIPKQLAERDPGIRNKLSGFAPPFGEQLKGIPKKLVKSYPAIRNKFLGFAPFGE